MRLRFFAIIVAAMFVAPAIAQNAGPSISAQPGATINLAPGSQVGVPAQSAPIVALPPGYVPADPQIGVSAVGVATVVKQTPPAKLPLGDYLGEALEWLAATFGTLIGSGVVALIVKLLQNMGIQASAQLRAKLQELVVNGLNLAASEGAEALKGKGEVEVKNALAARTLQYVQEHGADTLKKLGVDPASPKFAEAVKARIEAAVNDPAAPTPPVLDGPKTDVVAAPAKSA